MTSRPRHDLPPDWFCQGQTDLTELVDDEHIAGSMPASESERDEARRRFYEHLKQRSEEASVSGHPSVAPGCRNPEQVRTFHRLIQARHTAKEAEDE